MDVRAKAFRLAGAAMITLAGASAWAEGPATVEQARAVLDLATFPVPPDVQERPVPRLAALGYETAAGAADAFAFVKKALVDGGWAERPGAYSSADAASATFAKDGFKVSVSAFAGPKPGSSTVTITNHGDVDVKALPAPKDGATLYETEISIAYLTPGTVEATAGEITDALKQQGWEPYGEAGETKFYKRNAVRLTNRVAPAPAQQGKTMVDYSCELLSADLPAPADAARVQYADSTKELSFDAAGDPRAVFQDYAAKLDALGFEPIGKEPSKEGLDQAMLYRNADNDLLTLRLRKSGSGSRGRLRHQSAAEVEAMLAKGQASAAEKKAAADRMKAAPKPTLALSLPKSARDVVVEKGRIEFKTDAGQGLKAAASLLETLTKENWETVSKALEGPAGAAVLKKDDHTLTLNYTDVGFGDAEVSVNGIGVELSRKP